ncbi:MAG: hypothetical protein WKF77_32120 [Planctomycetaceae bacterium]
MSAMNTARNTAFGQLNSTVADNIMTARFPHMIPFPTGDDLTFQIVA